MPNNQELLQKNIETKTKELDILKSKILAEVEETKKKNLEAQQQKLEEDIQILHDQLDELQNVESNTEINKTKKETNQLKDVVEVKSDWTYELMQGSKMYDKLKEIGKTDKEVKEFAQDIDKVVRTFLDQELVGFSNAIKNSMSVGIQFAMMETLTKQGAAGSTEFFEAFSATKSGNAGKAFEGLYKAFGKLGSANEFFVLANKVQNLTWYLSDKKTLIAQSGQIPELMNPYKFKELLGQNVWSNQKQIDTLDITKIFHLNTSTGVDLADDEKIKLKTIVDNDNMPITEKTIAAIEKSLKAANKLLKRRGQFKDKTSDLVDRIAGFLDINIPFLGNLGQLAGLEFPTDLLGEKKDGGVLNFVLGVLGFRGGVSGLHKRYIQEKLDELHIDNTFISAAATDFQKNTTSSITNDLDTGTWKTCGLSAGDASTETAIKAKVPADYLGLKKSIVDNLDLATLNPAMVAQFAPGLVLVENGKNTVDISKISDKDVFVDQYLRYIIPLLADPSKKFIKSSHVDSNTFALAVFGGLVGDKYFIEGVNLGIVSKEAYILVKTPDTSTTQNSTTVEKKLINSEELTKNIASELQKYNSPVTTEMVLSTSKKFTVPVEYIMAFMKNDSHYGTQGLAVKTHNPGNVGNTDDGSTKDRGTWEAGVDAVGENLKKRIDAYQAKISSSSYPTVYELAKGISEGGIQFFGIYISAPAGADVVTTIKDNLVTSGISNKDQLLTV